MHRLSHHYLGHLVFHHELHEAVQIAVVLGPLERLERARERSGEVGHGETDAHGPDVDTHDATGRTGRRGPARRHLQVLRPPTGQVDLAGLVGDRRHPAAEVDLGGRVVRGLVLARPRRWHGRQVPPPGAHRAGLVGARVLEVGHSAHLPLAVATACSPACNAAGIPAGSVPPPWATSALPPPRPPTGPAAARSTSLADSPRSTAAGFSAATSATLPPDSLASRTTDGLSAGNRPRTSSARVRRSPPPRPAGEPVTSAAPPTSFAAEASWPAAARVC